MLVLCEYPGSPLIDPAEETLDELTRDGMKIIQPRRGYRFSMDSVLLAHFADVKPADRVLDLGCGSGVISFLLAADQPSACITGLELQPAMVSRARRSIELNGLSRQIEIVEGDLRQIGDALGRSRFDLVVANPPFWRSGEGRRSENQEKLIARHEVSAELNDYARAAAQVLIAGGRIALVHRAVRFIEICYTLRQHGLEVKRVRFIHPQAHQEANLVMVEGRKGAKDGVLVLPPLIVYDDDQTYSREINEIYFGKGSPSA